MKTFLWLAGVLALLLHTAQALPAGKLGASRSATTQAEDKSEWFRRGLSAAKVKRLIKGKTFYMAGSNGHCVDKGADYRAEPDWGEVKLNASATRLSYKEYNGDKEHTVERIKTVRGGIHFLGGEFGDFYSYLSLHTKRFLCFEDEGYMKLFKTRAAARRYYLDLQKKNRGFSKAMLRGKTFYGVAFDTYKTFTIRFTDRKAFYTEGEKTRSSTYTIDGEGVVALPGFDRRIHLRRSTSDYFEVGVAVDRTPSYEDRTAWFKKEYGRGVAGFRSRAEKLVRFLIKKGWMGSRVTRDGRIVGSDGTEGYWVIYDPDTLRCSVPDGDRLRFLSVKLAGSRLLIKEGLDQAHFDRFYRDEARRDTFVRRLIHGDESVDMESLIRGTRQYLSLGYKERRETIDLVWDADGKAYFEFFNPSNGRFGREEMEYTLDNTRKVLSFKEKNARWSEREHLRVIEHDAKGYLLLDGEDGSPIYVYFKRNDALEGVVNIDEYDCDGDD